MGRTKKYFFLNRQIGKQTDKQMERVIRWAEKQINKEANETINT
jgi:hypothetical protein